VTAKSSKYRISLELVYT